MTFTIASKAGIALLLTLGAAHAQTSTQTTPQAATPAPEASPVTPPAPGAAPATTAGTVRDCAAEFTGLDSDNDGFLSDSEAPDVNARARIDAITLQDKGVAREDYIRACDTVGAWTRPVAEDGAPFEGANSFTEGQAMDRAVSAGVIDVSSLEKDDKGIWRGKGTLDGAKVTVAVDYKGNVVTTAAP